MPPCRHAEGRRGSGGRLAGKGGPSRATPFSPPHIVMSIARTYASNFNFKHLNMNTRWKRNWIKKDISFIKLMEQYENDDAFGETNARQKEIWQIVSMRVGKPANYCKRKWTAIKHNYLQLMYMIRKGRVTEDLVRKNVRTSKYLDGRLDFLDRYLFKIPEAQLTFTAQKFFDSVFPCTQSATSVEKLIKVKENNVIEVIEDYKQETGKEPMSILPNIEIYESGSSITHSKKTFVNLEMDQAIQEVYRIDDDSNDEMLVEPDILPDKQISTSANVEFVNLGMDQAIKDYRIHDDLNDVQCIAPDILPNITEEDPIGDTEVTDYTGSSILKDILTSTKNEDTESSKPRCDLAVFLVKYTNKTTDRETDKDCNLKEYMNDLAEMLCRRLAPGKRKHFLSQIDLIVSEILEGT